MQQPVANRWLSEELLRCAQQSPALGASTLAANPFVDELERGATGSTAPSVRLPEDEDRRRLILFLTAGALLLGSIAFSYLAWSDTGANAVRPLLNTETAIFGKGGASKAEAQAPIPAKAVAPASGGVSKPTASPHEPQIDETSVALKRARVHQLRVQNAELQQRLAALQAALEQEALPERQS